MWEPRNTVVMPRRSARFPVALTVALLALTSCGADRDDEPGPVRFTRVEMPAGGTPEVLAGAEDTLLIGVRRDGARIVPGLLRRGPDGEIAEIAVQAGTPYGREARWSSLTTDGEQIVAIGGRRDGAHGTVRWSAWAGSDAGIVEHDSGTFSDPGAGDLVDAVLTPAGPVLVGTWRGERDGLDISTWTNDGDRWVRGPAAGTRPGSRTFPMAATALREGILVVGWELADGKQRPVVWQSSTGGIGWTTTALPDVAAPGAAVAARCWESVCAVAGRVDNELAVWSLTDGEWARLAGVPAVTVTDAGALAAPIDVEGRPTQVVDDGGAVKIAFPDRDGWTVRSVMGPTGAVTAVTRIGRTLYVVAGDGLWQTNVGSFSA